MQFAHKALFKRALGRAVTWSGWPLVQRQLARASAILLTYHGVSRGVESGYVSRQLVDADTFDAQLAWLGRRFRIISLAELADAVEGKRLLPDHAMVLTFDDGLRNVLHVALPLLLKHRVPAAVFVCPDWVGRGLLWTDQVNLLVMKAPVPEIVSPLGDGRRYSLRSTAGRERAAHVIRNRLKRVTPATRAAALERLRDACGPSLAGPEAHQAYELLSWDEVRVVADAGLEIGAHGCTHTVLTALTPHDAHDEIARSKTAIERELGRPCTFFAYPNGTARDFGEEHQRMLAASGYRLAVTQIPGVNGTAASPMALRRVNVGQSASLAWFEATISRAGW